MAEIADGPAAEREQSLRADSEHLNQSQELQLPGEIKSQCFICMRGKRLSLGLLDRSKSTQANLPAGCSSGGVRFGRLFPESMDSRI